MYVGLGDGGGAGDKHGKMGNGQDLSTLLGKILRINVEDYPYSIPRDNPFANKKGARAEIYAYGLRNPWKFSFDKEDGRLFCGDVGQNKYEEVNLIEKGKNFGWRIMEGNHCYEPPKNCETRNLEKPIWEYDHEEGKSITGGYVYRGKKYPRMDGSYICGDWTGKFFIVRFHDGHWGGEEMELKDKPDNLYITSFGQDDEGEIYVLVSGGMGPKNKAGKLYKMKFNQVY